MQTLKSKEQWLQDQDILHSTHHKNSSFISSQHSPEPTRKVATLAAPKINASSPLNVSKKPSCLHLLRAGTDWQCKVEEQVLDKFFDLAATHCKSLTVEIKVWINFPTWQLRAAYPRM